MKKLISCFILIGVVLFIPSCLYLIQNSGCLTNYNGELFYIIGQKNQILTIIGALIYFLCLSLMFLIYLKIIKKSDEFKNIKKIMLVAGIVGAIFLVILPNTSRDVFYYIGSGRLFDKYKVNPYYSSIIESGLEDEILNTVDTQRVFKFVYGPVFLSVCGLLSKISFASVTIFLYEFKILNFITYLATIYLIYVLTKKKKLAVVFAFNPLVILEILVNVHNEIFVIFFALLGILFLKKSDKSEVSFFICLALLALSACIKYIIIAILPFIILYKVRNEKLFIKIIKGIIYFLFFIIIFFLLYMPFVENPVRALMGIKEQSGKLKDSIYLVIFFLSNLNLIVLGIAYSIGFYSLLYIFIVRFMVQFLRKNNFITMMKNSYLFLMALIFIGMTNLTSWYLIWLFIPVFWTTGKNIKNMIYIRIFI